MTYPAKPLYQFQPNFRGMFLWWSSFKIVQRFKFYIKVWLLLYQKGGQMSNLYYSSSLNRLAGFQYNLVKMFLGWPSTNNSSLSMKVLVWFQDYFLDIFVQTLKIYIFFIGFFMPTALEKRSTIGLISPKLHSNFPLVVFFKTQSKV